MPLAPAVTMLDIITATATPDPAQRRRRAGGDLDRGYAGDPAGSHGGTERDVADDAGGADGIAVRDGRRQHRDPRLGEPGAAGDPRRRAPAGWRSALGTGRRCAHRPGRAAGCPADRGGARSGIGTVCRIVGRGSQRHFQTGLTNPGVAALWEYGAYGFQKYFASAGSGFNGARGAIFASGSYTHVDGYRDHSNGGIGRGQLRADYQVASRTRLSLDGELSSMSTVLPGQLTEAEFNANPNAAQPVAVAYGFGRDENRYRVGARLEQGLSASGSTNASAYYYNSGRTFDFRFGGNPSVDAPWQLPPAAGRRPGARGAGGRHVTGTDRRHRLRRHLCHGPALAQRLGAAGPADRRRHRRGPEPWRLWAGRMAVRAQRDAEPGPALRRGGLRILESFPGPEVDPQPGAAVQPVVAEDDAVLAHGIAGDGVCVGIARLRGAGIRGALGPSRAASLEELEPKSLWNYEVGARGLLDKRFLFDASVFLSDISNEFVPVDNNGVAAVENAGSRATSASSSRC